MSDLEKFASSSMRGPKRGIYQQLLGSLLIKANRSDDPLLKISCICEAAYLSRNKQNLDMQLIERCYKICLSFQNRTIVDLKNWFYVKIKWRFESTEENYKEYIEPWHKCFPQYYPLKTDWRRNRYPEQDRRIDVSPFRQTDYYNQFAEFNEKLGDKILEEMRKLPKDEIFYQICSALTHTSFNQLKDEFWLWAITQLLETQATLSDEIDPKIFSEIIKPEQQTEGEQNTDGDSLD